MAAAADRKVRMIIQIPKGHEIIPRRIEILENTWDPLMDRYFNALSEEEYYSKKLNRFSPEAKVKSKKVTPSGTELTIEFNVPDLDESHLANFINWLNENEFSFAGVPFKVKPDYELVGGLRKGGRRVRSKRTSRRNTKRRSSLRRRF